MCDCSTTSCVHLYLHVVYEFCGVFSSMFLYVHTNFVELCVHTYVRVVMKNDVC